MAECTTDNIVVEGIGKVLCSAVDTEWLLLLLLMMMMVFLPPGNKMTQTLNLHDPKCCTVAWSDTKCVSR